MKFWITLIVLTVLLAPKAFAGDDTFVDEDRERLAIQSTEDADKPDDRKVITVLLSHHHEMPTREALEAGTPDAREIVFEIAGDEEAFLFHRHRALRALTLWPDTEVYEYLHGLLVDDETEDGLRHHLLPILADGFGAQALDDLEPYLTNSEDPQIRISAAGAIVQIPGERALQTLLTALENEKHPLVQRRLENFAGRLR